MKPAGAGQKTSTAAHFEQARKSAFAPATLVDDLDEELDEGPDLPYPLEHVWGWFVMLHQSRRGGFGGVEPLTYPDIATFANLHGVSPTPMEVQALVAIDGVYREVAAEKKPRAGS